jgi:hypothetical protein
MGPRTQSDALAPFHVACRDRVYVSKVLTAQSISILFFVGAVPLSAGCGLGDVLSVLGHVVSHLNRSCQRARARCARDCFESC